MVQCSHCDNAWTAGSPGASRCQLSPTSWLANITVVGLTGTTRAVPWSEGPRSTCVLIVSRHHVVGLRLTERGAEQQI
jgi:hypothetical protein